MKKSTIFLMLMAVMLFSFFQSCEKSKEVPTKEVPKVLVKAQVEQGMTLEQQGLVIEVNEWLNQKIAEITSETDAEMPTKWISFSPVPANWFLPPTPIASSWWYPSITAGIEWGDTLHLAAFNCIINSDGALVFNGISLETAFPMINWGAYVKAWAVFDHQILFCAASLNPVVQTSPYQRHLFLVNSSGNGNLWWGRNAEDEVISEDGSVMLTNYYFDSMP